MQNCVMVALCSGEIDCETRLIWLYVAIKHTPPDTFLDPYMTIQIRYGNPAMTYIAVQCSDVAFAYEKCLKRTTRVRSTQSKASAEAARAKLVGEMSRQLEEEMSKREEEVAALTRSRDLAQREADRLQVSQTRSGSSLGYQMSSGILL